MKQQTKAEVIKADRKPETKLPLHRHCRNCGDSFIPAARGRGGEYCTEDCRVNAFRARAKEVGK